MKMGNRQHAVEDTHEMEGEREEIDIEEEFSRAISILSEFKRTAYLPKVQESASSFSPQSKIGGLPYLRSEDDWPNCPNCGKNVQLFLQLNLADLPERKASGLIQLFYCTTNTSSCESASEAFFPFSKATICRKIEVTGESS